MAVIQLNCACTRTDCYALTQGFNPVFHPMNLNEFGKFKIRCPSDYVELGMWMFESNSIWKISLTLMASIIKSLGLCWVAIDLLLKVLWYVLVLPYMHLISHICRFLTPWLNRSRSCLLSQVVRPSALIFCILTQGNSNKKKMRMGFF